MAKKLSKISKELKVGISDISEFLNNNGYDCEENPNERIPEDAIEFLRNNISSYMQEKRKSTSAIDSPKQEKEPTVSKIETPLEIKLIDCVSKHKLLIENIIGFTDYSWVYSVAKFHGTCSQPVKFTVFDEVISKLLLIKEMSLAEIGSILGFNIADEAEKKILLSAIDDLKQDEMLSGDESIYWLTDTGKEYAQNGVKFSTFERDFELYVDSTTDYKGNCKKVFERLKSEECPSIKDKLPSNLEEVKPLAEIQAPEIHFPDKKFILQSCQPTALQGYKTQLWVVLLENFRDQTIRALVYDESQDCVIEELSEALNQNEELKQSILEILIEKDKDNSEGIRYAKEEDKKEEQIAAIESTLISIQEEYDNAVNENNIEKAEEIAKNVFTTKRHFNSVEFEVELKRLFENTKCDLWIISPWIKKYATMHRLPFFEQYLQKGGRIFIAYSKPENGIDEMADEEAMDKLIELEKKYHNFYINQLDPFHFKYVWVRGATEGDWFYSGSFNILSFYVKKGLTKVRQEMMTKINWGTEEDEYFNRVLSLFGDKYLNRTKSAFEKFQKDDIIVTRDILKELKSVNIDKLNPFISRISEDFDKDYNELLKLKEDLLQQLKADYFQQQLNELTSKVNILASDKNLSFEKKKDVQGKLNTLKNEYPDYLDEMIELQKKIDSLKPRNLSRLSKPKGFNNNKRNFKKRR